MGDLSCYYFLIRHFHSLPCKPSSGKKSLNDNIEKAAASLREVCETKAFLCLLQMKMSVWQELILAPVDQLAAQSPVTT